MKPIASFPGLFIFMFVALHNTCGNKQGRPRNTNNMTWMWAGCREAVLGDKYVCNKPEWLSYLSELSTHDLVNVWAMERMMMKSSMLFQCDPSPPTYVHPTSTWLQLCCWCVHWYLCGLLPVPVDSHQLHNVILRPPLYFVFWFALVYYTKVEERQKQGRPENTYHVNGMEVKPHSS